MTAVLKHELRNYFHSFTAYVFGAITSAIDYVVTDELPQLYVLEGHGEAELPATFQDQIEKENIEINTLSLLTVDEIPEDAACLMIYAPQSDISQEEREILSQYVSGGGRLLVCAGAVEDGLLENLYGLLSDYGITAHDGLVVDMDRAHYAMVPYLLMPDLNSSPITDPLIDSNYYTYLPLSVGLTVGEDTGAGTVTALLTTSEESYSKAAGYELETYDREEGDTDGPFAVAVSVEDAGGGQIIWFASDQFLTDELNAYSSGANQDLAINALSQLIGESQSLAIRSRSLSYNYLTINEATASLLQVLMIGVFPLLFLGIGIYLVLRRRKMQHGAV